MEEKELNLISDNQLTDRYIESNDRDFGEGEEDYDFISIDDVDEDTPNIQVMEIRPYVEDTKKKCGEEVSWSSMNGRFTSAGKVYDKLEAGHWLIDYDTNIGIYFLKKNVELNKLYRLPNKATDLVLDDISKFWTLEDTYGKYSRVFKRNYLLYSAPGTGKTSLVNLMCQELIEKYDGIVVYLNNADQVRLYSDAMRMLREIEPDRKIITVIEDIDNFIGDSSHSSSLETELLNILDGNMKISKCVTIATTNYIDRLESRFKNRPSRFDRVVEFPLPNDASRRMFIEKSVLEEDLKTINLDEWVKKTKGFTIDHINELILLTFVFKYGEDVAFETITNMVNNNDKLKNKDSVNKNSTIGFKH